MTTDPITRDLLEKYGPRCICCGALATRLVVKGTEPPTINLTLGSLRMDATIPRGIVTSGEVDAIGNELKRIKQAWVEEVSQSEELTKVTSLDPDFNLGPTPIKEATLCDTCGDPRLRYQDLEIASLVREINPNPEPIRSTRFERILEGRPDAS